MTQRCILWHFRQTHGSGGPTPESLVSDTPSSLLTGIEVAAYDKPEDLFERTPTERRYDRIDLPRELWRIAPSQQAADLLWRLLPDMLRVPIQSGAVNRVGIAGVAAAVDDLPWEWLAIAAKIPGAPDGLEVNRVIPIAVSPPPLTVERPIRVLIVATNPKDERLLRPEEEIRAIRTRLNGGADYEVSVVDSATAIRASAVLHEFQPHILHYVGHSACNHGAGALILHDDRNATAWVGASEIGSALPISARLACLSTCFTAENYDVRGLAKLAHAPASVRLPSAVVNRYALGETAVRVFWNEFYDKLIAFAGDAAAAFAAGQVAVRKAAPNLPDWGSFSFVDRDGGQQPLRLSQSIDPHRFADEIKAQLTSSLANDMADKLRALGDTASSGLRDRYDREHARFSAFTSRFKS